MASFDEYSDIIDTRDIIERIAELESEVEEADFEGTPDAVDEQREELAELQVFADELRGYTPDFEYGEALVRDSYFEDHARELAEDIGAIKGDESWPLSHIDWAAAADQLKQDYTAIEWRGVTYWAR